ncbi:putative vacuolar membrane transporter for cationic amino acids [Coemansia sp. RSA 2706]|nr:putative vacuolar membrane transporter for cationic amino acids [Coemansia sp. RSA 2706]
MFVSVVASNVFGYVSLACWVFVLVPQVYLNHKRKSCAGVSLAFYLLWALGDLLNLAGALLENLLFTAILLPAYYIFTDAIVLSQFYYYRKSAGDGSGERLPLVGAAAEKRPGRLATWHVLAGGLAAAVLVLAAWLAPRSVVAQVCGYASAAVYLGAYVPQIVHNYRERSTEGLSMLMFVVVTIANITYCMSILTAQTPTHEYLRKYAAWLLGAAGTIGLELIILYQFYIYRHSHAD